MTEQELDPNQEAAGDAEREAESAAHFAAKAEMEAAAQNAADASAAAEAEADAYMKRHLTYAGATSDIFSNQAIDDIYRFSSGAARLINKVCTHCLLYGAQNGHRIIDDRMVKRVIEGELS